MPAERLRVVSIVGARPQFVKAAVMSRAIRRRHDEILVHTGQHYDSEMSAVFFDEMGIPAPDVQLESGSGTHAQQTATMLVGIEQVLVEHEPDWVVTFGDTNSTLAGALAAAKLHVHVAHVEAGLRSFNWSMPEEINRVLTDHLSRWLFCPTDTAVANLKREGIERGVHVVGDVMYELVVKFGGRGDLPPGWSELGIEPQRFVLATIHRAENTDDEQRLRGICGALAELATDLPVVVPLHPRTQKLLPALGLQLPPALHIVAPLAYGSMIAAEGSAALVITDSGGVQKEAYWLGTPCVTARDQTEWIETENDERNLVVGAQRDRLLKAARRQLSRGRLARPAIAESTAAAKIVRMVASEGAAVLK